MAIDRLTHVGDIKVGKVKGSSRIYPQLRLLSQYASLAGQKASVCEISGKEGDVAFLIHFGVKDSVAAYHELAERAEGSFAPAEPCRGFD